MTASADPLCVQLHPLFLSRKNFYQFLYLLFMEPGSGDDLYDIKKFVSFQDLDEIHEGGKILKNFFNHLSAEQVERLQEEYERLFAGPGPLAAPPWESYYRSKEHLLFDEWTSQVREEFHRFGLQSRKENNEPEDHLLIELEFMIFLTNACMNEKEDAKVIGLLSGQLRFLEQHLTVWVPYFSSRIIKYTVSQLYLGAAMLLEDFLSYDLETLHELLEAIRNG